MLPGALPTAVNTLTSSFLTTQEIRFDTNKVKSELSPPPSSPRYLRTSSHVPSIGPVVDCFFVHVVPELIQNLKSLLDLMGFFQLQETRRLLLKYQCQNFEGNKSTLSKKWVFPFLPVNYDFLSSLGLWSALICVSACLSPAVSEPSSALFALPSVTSPSFSPLLFDFL